MPNALLDWNEPQPRTLQGRSGFENNSRTPETSPKPKQAKETEEVNALKKSKLLNALMPMSLAAAALFGFAAHADTALRVAPSEAADAAGATATASETYTPLKPLDVHTSTSLTIVEQLRYTHFVRKQLDDSLSSEIFEKYLSMLDNQRMYLRATDVAEMEKYRYTLDEALREGDLAPAFDIFNRYQHGVINRLQFLLTELDQHFDKMDFTKDEDIELDRENAPWPRNDQELDSIWRKRLKAAALSMKLNGKEMPEIQELLSKRYKNRLKQTQQTKSEDAFQLYVNAFAATYDPHTQYFSPRTSQNFNINMSLSLEGIGAVLRNEDEYTEVVRLVPAGPADKAGDLKPNDRIMSVGHGDNGPLIDVVGWRLDDVVDLIRGPKGSTVRLEIQPDGSEADTSRIIAITRDTVQLEEQAAQKKLLTLQRGGQEYKLGVIEIPTFYADFKALQAGDPNAKSTTRDVRKLISELNAEGADGLIIDLRNNGGGSLQEADSLTGLFIESGPTVQVKSARRRPAVYTDNDDSVAWDGPLAVMVNRLSASASEIFAGAIQDYGRGIIVGSQTFGKGTVQTLIPLNRGQLKITAAKFYRVSGQSTQHQGIVPDVALPELFDVTQIGESSLDDALPWDMIQPALFTRKTNLEGVMQELRTLHDARVADDAEFNYLRTLAAKAKERSERTHLSLNEAARRQEKKEEDAWRLALENGLRAIQGKEPLASLDALEEEQDAEEDTDPSEDAMVRETGEVLLDLLGLKQQMAHVEALPQQRLEVN